MNKITKEQLLSMSNEQIKELTLGKTIQIIMDNENAIILIDSILSTPYASDINHSFVGFISSEGKTFYLQTIKTIIVM